jgi:hypothetical protein
MTLKVAIQCSSLGQRCGIATYSDRLNDYLNKIDGVESKQFVEKIRNHPDVISIQYEPGLMQPQFLQNLVNRYSQPIIVTAHHIGYVPQFYPLLDGIVLHSKTQIEGMGEPWNYRIIPHPSLVFPEKGKEEMKKKYGLPLDKKILGTAGFIAGTGKNLPEIVRFMLKELRDDEFLYLITSFWKGGDFGFENEILKSVKELKKENQFRIDSDFVTEEILNEKMQACDLLFAWNKFDGPGSTSGIAMDMIGSRRKLIVKNSPHYSYAASIKGVEVGNIKQDEFARDVLSLVRKGDLDKNIPDPTPYSWQSLTPSYVDYYREILGE